MDTEDRPIGALLIYKDKILFYVLKEYRREGLASEMYILTGKDYPLEGSVLSYVDTKPSLSFMKKMGIKVNP